ncbi:MFS transporter [Pseudalkalibacillus sp. SCS-8]|uniref:MFS transporter n=1 Tax=Pseudalkalibacillus nanhaiensis TaxID=3115291 RepID=UPI0032DB04CE
MMLRNRNINMIYLYIFFGQLFFDRALWVIYLSDSGLSLGEIGIIEAILHLSIVLFELPTGMIADLYGRKISILLGSVLSIGYGAFMLISDSLTLFSLAFVSLGVGLTFHSGAQQALAYDTLRELNKEKDYTKVFGNMTALALLSLSFAKLAGGLMAEVSWEWVYGAMVVMQMLALIPVLLLHEPEQEMRVVERKSILQTWRDQFISGLIVWKRNPPVRIPIILFISVSTVLVILTFYGQEYFTRLGYSSFVIGLIFTIDGLLGVVMAKLAYRLEKKWSFFSIVKYGYAFYLLFFVMFIVSPRLGIVLSFLALAQLVTLFEPVFSNFIQNILSSDVRSTFFSLISLVESFVIMVGFPAFGYAIEHIGFEKGFFVLLILLVLVYVGTLLKSRLC